MECAGRTGVVPDAGFGRADVDRLGRWPGGQPGAAPDSQGRARPFPAVLGAIPMKVSVLYFASVREKLGKDREEIDLPAEVSTIAALRSHLRGRGGAWADALAESRLLRTALNQDMVQPAAAIKPGD